MRVYSTSTLNIQNFLPSRNGEKYKVLLITTNKNSQATYGEGIRGATHAVSRKIGGYENIASICLCWSDKQKF